MIKKIALSAILIGLTAGIAQAAPVTHSALTTPAASTAIAPDWGVKRQTVGYKRRGFRRGGFGVRRGFRRGFRGHRYYRGHRFGHPRFYRGYRYGYRGFYGSRVRGLGTVR